jgi:HKD family nuclease
MFIKATMLRDKRNHNSELFLRQTNVKILDNLKQEQETGTGFYFSKPYLFTYKLADS